MWVQFSGLKKWIQFSGLKIWGRYIEKIQAKNQKKFKVPKLSKIVPKCPNVFWGFLLERYFLPTVPWRVESWKFFKKSKKSQSSIIAQNRSQKCANVFSTCFGANLSKIFICPVFPGGSGFRKFPKKSKKFKIPKVPKIVSKSVHTCFEHALGQFFRLFLPSVRCRAFQFFWT